MHIKVHWKTFNPISFLNLPPTQNSREALHTARGMYCMLHLLEIIRLSDFSSPLFYPSLLGADISFVVGLQCKVCQVFIDLQTLMLWWRDATLIDIVFLTYIHTIIHKIISFLHAVVVRHSKYSFITAAQFRKTTMGQDFNPRRGCLTAARCNSHLATPYLS